MTSSSYHQQLELYQNKISQLPTSDLKYPLFLLSLALLRQEHSKQAKNILDAAIDFIDSLQAFFDSTRSEQSSELLSLAKFQVLQQRYEKLINISGTSTPAVHLRQAALNLGGTVAAIGGSIIGGFIGGISGFTRGFWNINKGFSLEYTWTGILAGGFLGAALGFRAPKKICKNAAFRQLKFANDALNVAFERTIHSQDPLLDGYKDKAYQILLRDFFDGNKSDLDDFLSKKEFSYDIVTKYAQFISPKLERFIGHHSFIRLPIVDGRYFALELNTAPSDCISLPTQVERRTIPAQKILDMMSLHLLFQETDTLKFLIAKLKSGENDCFRRINDILIATNQAPTSLRRFPDTDNIISRSIGFFINRLSTYPEPLEAPIPSNIGKCEFEKKKQ